MMPPCWRGGVGGEVVDDGVEEEEEEETEDAAVWVAWASTMLV